MGETLHENMLLSKIAQGGVESLISPFETARE